MVEAEKFTSRGTSVDDPFRLQTLSIPIDIHYFHKSGFFSSIGLAYVHQDARSRQAPKLADGSDDFALVNDELGFKLPERRGLINIEVRNIIDNDFNF